MKNAKYTTWKNGFQHLLLGDNHWNTSAMPNSEVEVKSADFVVSFVENSKKKFTGKRLFSDSGFIQQRWRRKKSSKQFVSARSIYCETNVFFTISYQKCLCLFLLVDVCAEWKKIANCNLISFVVLYMFYKPKNYFVFFSNFSFVFVKIRFLFECRSSSVVLYSNLKIYYTKSRNRSTSKWLNLE